MNELFDYIPTLKDLIDIFESDYFGREEDREYSYTFKILDIL